MNTLSTASIQAIAEYVGIAGGGALNRAQGLARGAQAFFERHPLAVAAGVALLILLIWLTRPRTR